MLVEQLAMQKQPPHAAKTTTAVVTMLGYTQNTVPSSTMPVRHDHNSKNIA